MIELNSFQAEMRKKLTSLIDGLIEEIHPDPKDKDLPALCLTTPEGCQLWVYVDEAQIHGNGLHYCLEAFHFSNSKELAAKFISKVQKELC